MIKLCFSFLLCCFCLTLNAEVAYNIYAVDLASADYSEAYSLNNAGTVSGQYSMNGEATDFIWSLDSGVQTIQTHTVPGSHPHINNNGDVAGILVQNDSKEVYIYGVDKQLKVLGPWDQKWPKDKNMVVSQFNDQGTILLANHEDIPQAKRFSTWLNGKYKSWEISFPLLNTMFGKFGGLNNHNEIAIAAYAEVDLYFTSFQILNVFLLRNPDSNDYVEMGDRKKVLFGYGVNDQRQVISRNWEGTEGFMWSAETGMSSLGDFLPIDLNNKGEIIGKKGDQLQLRLANGEMIDLAQAIQYSTPFIEGFEKLCEIWDINENGWIVGTALIAGKRQAVLLVPQEIKG